MSKNTLFNYFTQSPGGKISPGSKAVQSPKQISTKRKLENVKNTNDSTPNKSTNGFMKKQNLGE